MSDCQNAINLLNEKKAPDLTSLAQDLNSMMNDIGFIPNFSNAPETNFVQDPALSALFNGLLLPFTTSGYRLVFPGVDDPKTENMGPLLSEMLTLLQEAPQNPPTVSAYRRTDPVPPPFPGIEIILNLMTGKQGSELFNMWDGTVPAALGTPVETLLSNLLPYLQNVVQNNVAQNNSQNNSSYPSLAEDIRRMMSDDEYAGSPSAWTNLTQDLEKFVKANQNSPALTGGTPINPANPTI